MQPAILQKPFSVQALETNRCPACRRPFDLAIQSLGLPVEEWIARRLEGRYPGWRPSEGACPECVLEAVHRARGERSRTPIHAALQLPYPVYSPHETQLLPTPVRVHAPARYTGRGVTIALLDSGFYPHPDLVRPKNRLLCHVDATGPQPVEKPRFKTPRVTSWHGLMTASIAAGSGFLSRGLYRGIASGARLVLVRTGNRRGRGIRERDIVRALEWVIANRERFDVRVVNISLGGDHPSTGKPTELDALVEHANAEGMVVVTAAGNSGAERIVPPASAASAVTVGGLDDQNSLDRRRHRMWHSSHGRGVNGVLKPEIVAPSVWLAAPMLPNTWVHNEAQFLWQLLQAPDAKLRRVLETDYAQARFKKETLRLPLDEIRGVIRARMIEQKYIHPHYQHVDGTSMAAPIVSGIAAQMLEANPALAPAQVKELLIRNADPLPGVSQERQGHGVVDAGRAVAAALRAPGGPLYGLPVSPRVTRRTVTFLCHAEGARAVSLVGSFNHWQADVHAMEERSPGTWQLTIPRPPPGEYAYKFLVDGSRWAEDPENPARVEDGYGGFHSLLVLERR